MLNCLVNKVGFWDGCGNKPSSLLLNNLRGFDISFPDFVTNEQKKTASELLQSCIDNGAQRVEDEFKTFMSPNQNVINSFSLSTVGEPTNNQKIRPQDGNIYGLKLNLCRATFIGIQLNSVFVYPKDSGAGFVRIWNLLNGSLFLEIPTTFIGGEINQISVDRLFTFDTNAVNLAVTFETDVDVYDVQPYQRTCTSCPCEGRYFNDYLFANAVKFSSGSTKIDSNAKGANHTGGMFLNYNLVCDASDLICSASSALKVAVWYAAGSAAMDEILFSKRLNSITTVHKESAKELKDIYEAEYSKYMTQITGSISIPRNPCFVCETQVKQTTQIP